ALDFILTARFDYGITVNTKDKTIAPIIYIDPSATIKTPIISYEDLKASGVIALNNVKDFAGKGGTCKALILLQKALTERVIFLEGGEYGNNDAEGNIDYDKITTFSAADYGFLVSYARLIKGIEFGGNVKIVHRKVGTFGKSWGFGIDLSARYELKKWQFGAMFRDISTTFNAWSYTLNDQIIETFTITGNEIPENSIEITLPRLLLGAARQFTIKEKFTILPEIGLDITFDGKRNTLIKSNFASIDPHLGIEFGYDGIVFLRSGVGNMQYILDINNNETLTFQPNIGIGVKIKRIAIDYALTDLGNASAALYSNIFSLKFDVVKPSN
ncbi:MAG: hypothetical protein JKY54_19170, partial [Flavobacteriales bacterium]|nr:hypothetical protein [Flavobacteriales bacterium]